MDGAAYLRKIDLKIYKSYPQLLNALDNMFKCSIGKYLLLLCSNLTFIYNCAKISARFLGFNKFRQIKIKFSNFFFRKKLYICREEVRFASICSFIKWFAQIQPNLALIFESNVIGPEFRSLIVLVKNNESKIELVLDLSLINMIWDESLTYFFDIYKIQVYTQKEKGTMDVIT